MFRLIVSACAIFLLSAGCSDDNPDTTEGKVLAPDSLEPSITLSHEEYLDPKGFFLLTPPGNWKIQEYPDDPRGKATFIKSTSVDLRILTNAVDYSDVSNLEKELRAIEKAQGLKTNIRRIEFNNTPAIERDFQMGGSRLLVIDFVHHEVAHNLMYSAPVRQFDDSLGMVNASFATYQPIDNDLTEAEKSEHSLAKNRRLGRLFLDQGRYGEARQYINAGLVENNTDTILLQLLDEVQNKESN